MALSDRRLGSISALSLAASPTELPVIATAAGIGLTVGVVAITYKAFKDLKERKLREEIEHINELHQRYLSRIFIPGYNEIRGFPPIFKLSQDKDSSAAESLHYTDDEIEDIGKSLPHGTDVALASYRQSIKDAILKLKEYYLLREDHHDTTSGVLSYLLNMLQTKCLNFEGYDYDIAYIKAISKFINKYASEFGEQSRHFTRLNNVYSYLQSAQQKLEIHKEKLALDEILSELRDSCIHDNDILIRKLTQMVIKNKNWELLKTVTLDELSQGILRKEYVRNEIKGVVLCKDHEKLIPDTVFEYWIKGLSNYYLDTLDSDNRIEGNLIEPPEKMFNYPGSATSKYSEKQSDNELKKIRDVFKNSINFITTKVNIKASGKLPEFISISEDKELIERTRIMAQFATLIHQSTSLQYLCTQLLKSTKLLGEIYVKSPKNFCRVFLILKNLCIKISDDCHELKKSLTILQRADLNTMQLVEKEIFPDEIKDALDSINVKISNFEIQINTFRENAEKNIKLSDQTAKSVKHAMFEVAGLICNMYKLCDDAQPEERPFVDNGFVMQNIGPETNFDEFEVLSRVISSIRHRISTIISNEKPTDSIVKAYTSPLNDIIVLGHNALSMDIEPNKTVIRTEKARKTLELTITLCKQTSDFLNLTLENRVNHSLDFCESVLSKLNDERNHFLDIHNNQPFKDKESILGITLFKTTSRKAFMKFRNSCSQLAQSVGLNLKLSPA